jgi:hypothetical protein
MREHTPQHSDSQSKKCARCTEVKPLTDFYERTGVYKGHYLSECKDCMKARSKTSARLPANEPRAATEILAINALKQQGIPAGPGKAYLYADVDVVAFGCVRVEVKYAKLDRTHHREKYTFHTTPRQGQRGLLADVVMLICDDGDTPTFHLFRPDDEVFFIKGRLKTGFTFTPGAVVAEKHGNNRVVMTQPMMDTARNRWALVWAALKAQSDALKQEGA